MSAQTVPHQRPGRVIVTGSTGLVGSSLMRRLRALGYEALRLVRALPVGAPDEVYWNPAKSELDLPRLEGIDAVVHLAGENIAAGRWTAARKAAIRDSRVAGTYLLCEGLARLHRPPRVLIAASAIGYYGDRGDELLTEQSGPGRGFLPELVSAWEAATEPARQAGLRVVNLRIGLVLARGGGALARMLTPFRLFLGGPVGSGRQYWSWIALSDLVAAIEHLLRVGVGGPVNATAPTPVTNAEFARALGRVLRRPAALPVPSLVVRAALGQMGRELLLASARVLPQRLLVTGFSHRYPRLNEALRAELAAGT